MYTRYQVRVELSVRCVTCCRPTLGGGVIGSMSGAKTPPSFNPMVFNNPTSTMPGSPRASSLLNPNYFPTQLDFPYQGMMTFITHSPFGKNRSNNLNEEPVRRLTQLLLFSLYRKLPELFLEGSAV